MAPCLSHSIYCHGSCVGVLVLLAWWAPCGFRPHNWWSCGDDRVGGVDHLLLVVDTCDLECSGFTLGWRGSGFDSWGYKEDWWFVLGWRNYWADEFYSCCRCRWRCRTFFLIGGCFLIEFLDLNCTNKRSILSCLLIWCSFQIA